MTCMSGLFFLGGIIGISFYFRYFILERKNYTKGVDYEVVIFFTTCAFFALPGTLSGFLYLQSKELHYINLEFLLKGFLPGVFGATLLYFSIVSVIVFIFYKKIGIN